MGFMASRRPRRLAATAVVLAAALLLSVSGPATAGSSPPANPYSWWQWPSAPAGGWSHVQREVDLTVLSDPGPSSDFFFAYQFAFRDGSGGYLGLQTRGPLTAAPGGATGRIAIFSVFDACDDNRPTSGCGRPALGLGGTRAELLSASYCQPLTDRAGRAPEGPGASCRVPYDWRAGVRYRLRLTAVGGGWWRAAVVDTRTGVETGIGQVQVPTGWGALSGHDVSWIEYYGPQQAASRCGSLPLARARWEAATGQQPAGGSRAPVNAVTTTNLLGTVDGACPESSVTALPRPAVGAIQEVGGPAR
jgi:hypothetical protein